MKEKVKYSSSSFFSTKLSRGGENAPTHKLADYIVTEHSTCTHLLQVFNVLTLERILPTNGIQIWFGFYILTRDSELRMGLNQVLLNEKDNPNMVPWSLTFQKYFLFGQTKHKTLNKFDDLILEFQYPFFHSGLQFTIAKDPPSFIQAQSASTTHTWALIISVRCYLQNCNIYRNVCTPELQWVEGTWRREEKQKEEEDRNNQAQ